MPEAAQQYYARIWTGAQRLWQQTLRLARQAKWGLTAIFLIFAAQIALYAKPILGVYIDALALAGLVAVAMTQPKLRQLMISLAVLPTATLVSLCLPESTLLLRETVFYSSLLVLGMVYRFSFSLDYPLAQSRLTLKNYAIIIPSMLVLGQIIGLTAYLLLRNHYPFGHTSLPLVAVSLAIFALTEEIVFRGLIQQRAIQAFTPFVAGSIGLLAYLAYSFGPGSTWLSPLVMLFSGLAATIVYAKKQNLLLTFALNLSIKLVYFGLVASFIFR